MSKRKKIRRIRERLQRRLGRRIFQVFTSIENLWLWPAGLLAGIWGFVAKQFRRWQNSKSFRSFMLGLPSVLVTSIVSYVAIVSAKQSPAVLSDRYDRQAQTAIAENDSRYSRLCLERLLQLRGEDTQTLFRLAQVYAAQDDYRRVAALMNRLAPSDQRTIPEAHLWRAQSLLAKGQLTQEELVEVETQLSNAIALRPLDPLARSLFGQVYAQTDRPKQAIEMFKRINNRSPGDSYRLAEISAAIGDVATAREAAEDALAKYQKKLDEDYRSWSTRKDVVKTKIFLEQFEDAIETLRQARDHVAPDDLKEVLAKVYGTWVQVLQLQQAEIPKRIAVTELALRADPNSVAALDSIANLLSVADKSEQERLRGILQGMLAAGRSTPLVHLCIGTDAILRDNLPEGIKHLQLAYQGEPTLVAAANNLAWAMMQSEPSSLDQALSLVDTVILRAPEIAAVRDTRGQILLKLGRWDEAITELERALRDMPDSELTREGLIQAYDAVGLSSLANEHRELLARLKTHKQPASVPD